MTMHDSHPTSHDDTAPVRDCQSAMAKLFDLLDGEVTPEKAKQLRLHITSCPDCFTEADFEKRFLDAVAESGKRGSGCPEQVRQRVLAALKQAGLSAPASS